MFISVLIVPSAFADTIELRNGNRLTGVILRESTPSVIIDTSSGRVTLPRTIIRSIVYEGEASRHLWAGDVALSKGDLERAAEEYTKAAEYPEAVQTAQLKLQDLESVRRARYTAQEARLRDRAEMLRNSGKIEQAVALITKYLEENEASPELIVYRGTLRTELAFWYYDHVRNDDALRQIELARQDNAPPELLHLMWAKIDALENRFSFARQEFEMALKANPNVVALAERSETVSTLLVQLQRPDPTPVPLPIPPKPLKLGESEIMRRIREAVLASTDAHGVDPLLVEAVIMAESSFRPDAVSPAGAQGLMQLMPATAQMLGVTDAFDIAQNIEGGVSYLAMLQQEFGAENLDLVLAGYNAGPGRVHRYNKTVPPYKETQAYVQKVQKLYGTLKENPAGSRFASATP